MWISEILILINLAWTINFTCQFAGINLTENRIAASPSAINAYSNANENNTTKLYTEFIPGDQAWNHQSKPSFGALVFLVFPPTKFLQSCCSMNSFFIFIFLFSSLLSVFNEFMTRKYKRENNIKPFMTKRKKKTDIDPKETSSMHFLTIFSAIILRKQNKISQLKIQVIIKFLNYLWKLLTGFCFQSFQLFTNCLKKYFQEHHKLSLTQLHICKLQPLRSMKRDNRQPTQLLELIKKHNLVKSQLW